MKWYISWFIEVELKTMLFTVIENTDSSILVILNEHIGLVFLLNIGGLCILRCFSAHPDCKGKLFELAFLSAH